MVLPCPDSGNVWHPKFNFDTVPPLPVPAWLGDKQPKPQVWCRACNHQVEPDPAAMAERYGADTAVSDWHKRLVCSRCGEREIDFVLTGASR